MNTDPVWEHRGRDAKAREILGTLQRIRGDGVTEGRWLDIGCGSGDIAFTLAADVEWIDAIDLEGWTRWEPFAKERSNLTFRVGACDQPSGLADPSTYDVVICNQVYEHVNAPQQLLRNIRDVLKPGGVCYFAGPNLLWPIEPHVHWPVVHWLPRWPAIKMMNALGSRKAHDLDAYSASHWTLRRWFSRCGFEVHDSIAARMSAADGPGWSARIQRMAGKLPRHIYSALAPFVPSFVFVLVRPDP